EHLDVVMPKMSGTQLASHFRERCPHAKVLLMSGYTDEAANRHGVLESGHALLQKPFMPNALLLRVRKILDETVTPRPQVVASPSQAPPRA
ncbi:response regulator, partial [bacterium]|nr:response regulator [bacterium]